MRRPSRRSIPRGGYTLLEMLIVIVLLVVLVGMAWPAMQRPLHKGQIRAAAKQVRKELLRARLEAIRSGSTLVFRFQPGAGLFEVVPQAAGDGQLDPEAAVSSEGFDSLVADTSLVETDTLGDPSAAPPSVATGPQYLGHQIRFWAQDLDDGFAVDQAADATAGVDPSLIDGTDPAFDLGPPDASALAAGGVGLLEGLDGQDALAGDGSWSWPIIFYPNGRTSNARIRLSDQGEYYVDVRLRGLTGSARVGKVRRWADVWQEETLGEDGSPAGGVLEEVPLETIAPQAGPSLEGSR